MQEFELYYDDLTPEAQKRFDEFMGEHNYDAIPITVIYDEQ